LEKVLVPVPDPMAYDVFHGGVRGVGDQSIKQSYIYMSADHFPKAQTESKNYLLLGDTSMPLFLSSFDTLSRP
jgi:hypothetical protein